MCLQKQAKQDKNLNRLSRFGFLSIFVCLIQADEVIVFVTTKS